MHHWETSIVNLIHLYPLNSKSKGPDLKNKQQTRNVNNRTSGITLRKVHLDDQSECLGNRVNCSNPCCHGGGGGGGVWKGYEHASRNQLMFSWWRQHLKWGRPGLHVTFLTLRSTGCHVGEKRILAQSLCCYIYVPLFPPPQNSVPQFTSHL